MLSKKVFVDLYGQISYNMYVSDLSVVTTWMEAPFKVQHNKLKRRSSHVITST